MQCQNCQINNKNVTKLAILCIGQQTSSILRILCSRHSKEKKMVSWDLGEISSGHEFDIHFGGISVFYIFFPCQTTIA